MLFNAAAYLRTLAPQRDYTRELLAAATKVVLDNLDLNQQPSLKPEIEQYTMPGLRLLAAAKSRPATRCARCTGSATR